MTLRASNRVARVQSWLGGGALVLLGCGANSVDDPSLESQSAGAAASASSVPGAREGADFFGACPRPLGTAEELARTPRADPNLELLALTLDAGQLTATQATYERVVADVGAIRASAPSLANIAFSPPHDGHTLLISFGDNAMDALAAGRYSAWDCLLEAYRVEIGPVDDLFPYAPTLFLDGIFDMPRLGELFEQLPDASVQINVIAGPRPLCATRQDEHYEYVVDRTNGKCVTSPCRGIFRRFVSDAAGEVSALESWTSTDGPAPAWFSAVCN
jgi:hypothetical protein